MAGVLTNYPSYGFRIRYDIINGTRTGPFKDPSGQLLASRVQVQVNKQDSANFAKLKRAGLRLPENPYSRYLERLVIPNGGSLPHLVVYWIPTGDYSEYYGPSVNGWNTLTYLDPTAAEWTSLETTLHAKLLSKIKNMKVNLGNFIGERDQMFNMFGSTARKLSKAINHVKRGRFKKAAEALGCLPTSRNSVRKSVANNWLELQYGWLPLLSDLYEMSLLVEEAFKDSSESKTINSSTATVSWSREDATSLQEPPGLKCRRANATRLRGKVNYKVEYQDITFLGSIGLTNPLSIAWELTRLSFVVDWALPVGRMLENLDATIGCTFLSSTNSSMRRNFAAVIPGQVLTKISGNYKYVWKNFSGMSHWFRYDRWVVGGFPPLELPQPKNPFSAAHAANGMALLAQSFR